MTIQRIDHADIVADDLAAAEPTLVHERLNVLREALHDIAAGAGPDRKMAPDRLPALAAEPL